MSEIKIMVQGKAMAGKSTIMEIIHGALSPHFPVELRTICNEQIPSNPYLSKRIDALKKKKTTLIVYEIQERNINMGTRKEENK